MSGTDFLENGKNILKCRFFAFDESGNPVAIEGEKLFELFQHMMSGEEAYVDALNKRIDESPAVAIEPGNESSLIDEIGGEGDVAQTAVTEVTEDVVSEEGDGDNEDIEGVVDTKQPDDEESVPVETEKEENDVDVSLPVNEGSSEYDGIKVPEDIDTQWITEIDNMETSGFKVKKPDTDFDPSSYVSVYNAGRYDDDKVKDGILVDGNSPAPVSAIDDNKFGEYEEDSEEEAEFGSDEGFITEAISTGDFEGEVTTVDEEGEEEDADATPGEDFTDPELDPYMGVNPSSIENPFEDFDSEGESFEEEDNGIDFGDEEDTTGLSDAYDFDNDMKADEGNE